MNCPVCRKPSLTPGELVPGLAGRTCDRCAGVWIAGPAYEVWRKTLPAALPVVAAEPPGPTVPETPQARICPQCGQLMLRYRAAHDLPFMIEHCSACASVWLDRHEWDALRARNLHDKLHEIVSARWQADVRRQAAEAAIEKTYARRLGPAYAKAREVRDWLRQQPERALILTYLGEAKPQKE